MEAAEFRKPWAPRSASLASMTPDPAALDLTALAPILTDRLRLRAFTDDDAPRLTALLEAREVVEFTPYPHPYGLEDARAFLARQRRWAEEGAAVHWAIEPRDTPEGSPDGLCGGVLAKLEAQHRCAELGYWLGRNRWGRGLATEAAAAALAWCFDDWGANRVQAEFVPRNPGSRRVLEKLGLRPEGLLRQRLRRFERYEDLEQYALLRAEREARP